MDLSLSYRALASGQVDLIAGDATAGLIRGLDLVSEDTRHSAYKRRHRRAGRDAAALSGCAGGARAAVRSISADDIRAMNSSGSSTASVMQMGREF